MNGLTKLKKFIANDTFFRGNLPSLAGMSKLEYFQCTGCALDGHIVSLKSLKHLKYFAVTDQPLEGGLTGSIPSLAGLSQLQYFDVEGDFTGKLPDLSGLTQLQTFYVDGYRFTGGVPDLVDLPNLREFAAGGLLTGHLGKLSNLPNLQVFGESYQLLTGEIPQLGQLPSLQQFEVTGNQLTGNIPDLSGLPNLQYFNVAYNQLTGPLPTPPQALVDYAATGTARSAVCPNRLTPASNPPSVVDMSWSAITHTTPWSKGCEPDHVVDPILQLVSSRNPSMAGQPVTFTAVVHGMKPTGTATFTAKSAQPGTKTTITLCDKVPVIDEIATCTANDLVNNDSTVNIFVAYSGDADNAPATTPSYLPFHQQVHDVVAEKSTANPALAGQPVDLTLTYGNGKEDDTADFYEGRVGAKALCVDVPVRKSRSGQFIAHCVTSFVTAGPHLLTATTEQSRANPDPIIQHIVAAKPFDADQFALTGPWYNPATSGQGLQFSVYPDLQGDGKATLVGGWFTFDDSGHQRWVALQGDLSSRHGGTFDLKIGQNSGGNFNAGPVTTPAAIIGSAALTFYDCGHAAMSYQFDDGRSGTIPYVRLDPSTACSSTVPATAPSSLPAHYTDVLHSVAWYDPATSGQGLYLDLVPASTSLFGAWFTYAPQGTAGTGVARQRWFTLQDNNYTPGDLDLHDVKIIATTGGKFNEPTPVAVEQVGTADMNFTSCTTMSLTYRFDKGEFSGLAGTINEQVIGGENPACEQQ